MRSFAKHLFVVFVALNLLPAGAYAINLATDLGTLEDLQAFAVFLTVGFIGMVGHYLKKWLRNEITGGLLDYLVRDHPKETMLSVFALIGAALSVYLSGQLHGMPLGPLVMSAFTTGWTCDSALNKGVTP